ncbi:MAG: hypothetical protein K8S27_01400 [Candidatus Omnitrophica bacterium]|nr:hypothetical protein [Candidatus Omnitrophota bacterium]
MDYIPHHPVSTPKYIFFLVCFVFLCSAIIFDGDGYILILDYPNLFFHEAGHVFLGFFGETIGLYGGTLGQLIMPFVCAVTFLLQLKVLSFAVMLLWFFQNFFNIARYMADARAHELFLVGGGKHDWTDILSRWGILESDTALAAVVRYLGWLGLIGTFVGITIIWQIDNKMVQQKKGGFI